MKTVWILSNGERHEGASVSGVYTTEDKAREAALKHSFCFDGGWVEEHLNYWENGCDFLEIKEWTIE